jgi:hypothetical protein
MKFHSPQILAAALVAVPFFGPVALAEDPPPQNIVISLQSDPLTDQEPACVALQLGAGLIRAGAKVTIFATLDGVGIANADVMGSPQLARAPSKFCKAFDEEGVLRSVPLPTVLDNYLAAHVKNSTIPGEILACQLCWVIKFGDLTDSKDDKIDNDQISIGSPIELFMTADKVIDY